MTKRITIFVSFFMILIFYLAPLYSQPVISNIRTYNSNSGADDFYSAIVCDNSGNIFAAGYCTDGIISFIILEKFNSAGTKLWSKTYRSQVNGYDIPVSIALDSAGGIYVAGYTKGLTTSYDFLLIKYNQQGDTIWSKRYNGTANGDDRTVKVAVDKNNSIILAGNAMEIGQGCNMILIKYDLNGNQLWLKKYDGTNHLDDRIKDFSFDKNNYLYIAASVNSGTYANFCAMKINTLGDTIWTRTYLGNSEANAIIVDDSLNVYTTGKISQDSVFTVKFNSTGSPIWTARYCEGVQHRDYGYRIAFDELGYVYIAGELNSIVTSNSPPISDGYIVIKYSTGGQQVWASRVARNYPGNYPCFLNIYNSSNIYLSYKRFGSDGKHRQQCVKFNSNGDSVWVRTIGGQYYVNYFKSSILDKTGNLLFGSNTAQEYPETDAALLKYNSNGNLVWDRYYNSQGSGTDYAISIGKDAQNNIYVSGMNNKDFIFIKYNSSFTQKWAVTYQDIRVHDESQAFSVVDNSGNTYLTSTTKDSLDNKYIILLKYDSSGTMAWQRRYTANPATPWGICIDKIGDIIIAGTDWDNYSHSALKLLKYSPSGSLLMTTTFNAPNNSPIWIYTVDTDLDNNILIAGSSHGAMTWKFKTNGTLIWERYWVSTYVHQNNKLIYDKKNNIYVCGFTGTSSGYDYLTVKYDSAGNQKWVKTFNGIRSSEDFALDLVNDTLGNTYVTGYACNQPSNWDRSVVTIKYDSIGNAVWIRDFHFYQNGHLQPVMMNKDRFNNIYILCGYNYYQPPNAGYLLIKYKPNGDSVWSFTYSSPIARNYGKALLLMGDDKIYMTGRAYGNNTGYDITTIELSQTIGIKNLGNMFPDKFELFQNYPNPFNPTTKISFSIPAYMSFPNASPLERGFRGVFIGNLFVSLKVYDITGREIQTLVNEKLNPGTYEVTFDGSNYASGIYFYQLRAGEFIETKKLILLK